jgi:hypothetical protein
MVSTRSRRDVLMMLAAAAATPILAACADGKDKGTGAAAPSAAASPSAAAASDLMAKLATYPGDYRFPDGHSIAYNDEPALAKARLAVRAEMANFVDWARTNAHPEVIPALPRVSVKDHDYDLDAVLNNLTALDTSPLWGSKEPLGRLVPDTTTVNSGTAGMQTGLALFMIKAMLSKAEYAKLITNSTFTRLAAGKNLIEVYPYSTVPLTEPYIPQGILKAFHNDASMRWLIANPGANLTQSQQTQLKNGGGTLYTETGNRKLYVDSVRADQTPIKVAAAMYEALRAVNVAEAAPKASPTATP